MLGGVLTAALSHLYARLGPVCGSSAPVKDLLQSPSAPGKQGSGSMRVQEAGAW